MHGIPISYKDIYYTNGIPTTACSKVLIDFVPDYDATIVKRFSDAVAVMLGKTNTTEFAFGPTNEESYFGPARNPWNTDKIPGGSSGGSAIAAATGMSYISMGADSGGSIRIPAAMTGVVGFKPSVGLLSLYGLVPMSFSMDHPGPLCRSVLDTAIAIDAVSGNYENDTCPLAIRENPTRFYDEVISTTDLKGKVFGIPVNFFFDKTDFDVERVYFEAIDRIKALGGEFREVFVPGLDDITEASTHVMFSEAAWLLRDLYPAKRDDFHKDIPPRIDIGHSVHATQYIKALEYRKKLMLDWQETLNGIDAVLVPTCPIEPFDIGLGSPWNITTRGKVEMGKPMATYHTRLSNMTGAPALSVPAGLTKSGLPVGLMIMGKMRDDLGVLKIGAAYESIYKYPVPDLGH